MDLVIAEAHEPGLLTEPGDLSAVSAHEMAGEPRIFEHLSTRAESAGNTGQESTVRRSKSKRKAQGAEAPDILGPPPTDSPAKTMNSDPTDKNSQHNQQGAVCSKLSAIETK